MNAYVDIHRNGALGPLLPLLIYKAYLRVNSLNSNPLRIPRAYSFHFYHKQRILELKTVYSLNVPSLWLHQSLQVEKQMVVTHLTCI